MSKKNKDSGPGNVGVMNIDGEPMRAPESADEVVIEPEPAGPVARGPVRHVVAPKRSITAGRHVFLPGQVIEASHLSKNPKAAGDSFAAHIKAGNIVKK